MVASKFLHDDGEDDEVIVAEWAISGKITVTKIKELEKDFLSAIVSNILYKTLFLEITKLHTHNYIAFWNIVS